MIEYLVFQGGGVATLGYAGGLQALQETGRLEHIKGVAGTSAGAICAALVANKTPPDRIAELLQRDFSAFTKDSFGGWLEWVGDLKRLRKERGLNSSKHLERIFEEWLGPITFRELPILLEVFACDWRRKCLTKFSVENYPDLKVAKACAASACIPIFYTPVEVNGVEYVDGGIIANYPLGNTSFVWQISIMQSVLGFRLRQDTVAEDLKSGILPYAKALLNLILGLSQYPWISCPEISIDRVGVRATEFSIKPEIAKEMVHRGRIDTLRQLEELSRIYKF